MSIKLVQLVIFVFAFISKTYSDDNNKPLGETFVGQFLCDYIGDAGDSFCNIPFDVTQKTVQVSRKWSSSNLCSYCLMVKYNDTSEIYPIQDQCVVCDTNDVLISFAACKDFADDPDDLDEVVGVNFTFVVCPIKPDADETTTLTTAEGTKEPSTILTSTHQSSSATVNFTTSTRVTTTNNKLTTTTVKNSSSKLFHSYYIRSLLLLNIFYLFIFIFFDK